MIRPALLCLPLALMSCATPQERCIASVTRDLTVVYGLIAETQANLARGYSLEEVVISTPTWVYCDQPVLVAQPDGSRIWINGGGMCLDDYTRTTQRPRAIDPEQERRKLDGLIAQQALLTRQATPAVELCRLQHPQ
jgi:hypothetical protein